MAKQSLATIKSWFKRGAKPTAAQFASVFDSFFHKDESIPQSNISELGTTITALETLISKNKQITIQQEYDGLVNKDSGTVYFCADTGNLYLGQVPLFEPDAFTSATLGNDGIVTFTRHGNGASTTFTLDMNPLLVQPDWNQNDSEERDYVKNRTHYEDTIEMTSFEKQVGESTIDFNWETPPTAGNTYYLNVLVNGNPYHYEAVARAESETETHIDFRYESGYIGTFYYLAGPSTFGDEGTNGRWSGNPQISSVELLECIELKKLDEKYIPESIARKSELANVAHTGDYEDLENKPSIPDAESMVTAHNTSADAHNDIRQIALGVMQNLSDVEALIPNQATPQNQLADKNFVNSSISTNTADYKGLVIASNSTEAAAQTALSSISGMNNNDYAFVKVADTPQVGVDTYKRYKYDGSAWLYEYTLNNSSFTAAQWAAINAGITPQKVDDYDGHLSDLNNPHGVTKTQVGLGNVDNTSDTDKPISTAQQAALLQKQNVLNVGNNIKINNDTISALYDLVCEPTGTTMNTRIGKFTQGEYLVVITAEGQGGIHKSAIAFVHISTDGTITNNEINYLGDLKLMGMYSDGNANYIVVDTDPGTFRYSAQIIVIRRTAATAFEAEMSRTTNGGQASVLKKEFNLKHLVTSNGMAEISLNDDTGLVSIRSTASGVEIISTGGQVVLDGGSAGVLVNSMLRVVGTTYFNSDVFFSGNLTFGGNAFNAVKETAMHTSVTSQGMPSELGPDEFVHITAPLTAFAPICVGAISGKANEYYGRFEAGANITPAGTDNDVAITWYGNAIENGGIYEFSILEGVGIITRLN